MTGQSHTEKQTATRVRPKLSASLLIADTSSDEPRFLFGKRHERHRFMPGTYVFPGGRIDPCDHDAAFERIAKNDDDSLIRHAFGARRSRLSPLAPAVCALRETYEETGILIGQPADESCPMVGYAEHRLQPDLRALRMLARATTPPAYPIRFETFFFIAFRNHISIEGRDFGPDSELSGLVWASEPETRDLKLPVITRWILDVALERLRDDPKLERAVPVPDFYTRRGQHLKRWLSH